MSTDVLVFLGHYAFISSILLTAQQSHREQSIPNISAKKQKLKLLELLELPAVLTHEQDSGPGSKDVDDVIADYLGERLHAAFLPQPLLAGVLIVLKVQVVGAVWGLWSSAGENIFRYFAGFEDIL